MDEIYVCLPINQTSEGNNHVRPANYTLAMQFTDPWELAQIALAFAGRQLTTNPSHQNPDQLRLFE